VFDDEAKERHELSKGRGQKGVENLPHLNEGKSRDKAGEAVAVSGKSVDDEAKERQKIRKGNQPGASPENLPELKKGDSRDKAGEAVAVSGKSVDDEAKERQRASGGDKTKKAVKENLPELDSGKAPQLVENLPEAARRSEGAKEAEA
jgi:hypothetical protein